MLQTILEKIPEAVVVTTNNAETVMSIPIYPSGVYTFNEAAELSKCSYSTIRRAVDNSYLESTHIGNQPRLIGEADGLDRTGRTDRTKQRDDVKGPSICRIY